MLFSFRPITLPTEEEEGDFARGLLSLPELSRKIEEDSARRVSPYWEWTDCFQYSAYGNSQNYSSLFPYSFTLLESVKTIVY